jgi:hypothetical protein
VIGTLALWRVTLWTSARFMYVRPRWLRLVSASSPEEPAEAPRTRETREVREVREAT